MTNQATSQNQEKLERISFKSAGAVRKARQSPEPKESEASETDKSR